MTAQSALIVAVPAAEAVVGALRERCDPAARDGAPPHVTILFPFVAPDRIARDILDRLGAAVREIPGFEFSLPSMARFPETLYLAPEPAEPFVRLTLAIARAFPGYPPYGGQFSTVIPHLTVAHGSETVLEDAHLELQASLERAGELRFTCGSLSLIENRSGRWAEAHSIPIGR